MLVGHLLASCTSELQYAIIDNASPCEGHRVIIVDTPGFDDTFMDEVEILRRIAVWLASSYVAIFVRTGDITVTDHTEGTMST